MSLSHALTLTLNAVFYVWLRVLALFIRGKSSSTEEPGVYSHGGVKFISTSAPPEFSRPQATGSDIRPLVRDATESPLFDSQNCSSPLISTIGSPSFVYTVDAAASTTSTPFSSAPTTPDLADELLIPIVESQPRIIASHANSWDDDLDLEEGLGRSPADRKSSGLSLLGSSTSVLSKLDLNFLVPSPSFGSQFLHASTPRRNRSSSTLPQFTQDVTSVSLPKDGLGLSFCGDEASMVATLGGTPPQSPDCHANYFDFSVYDNVPDRRHGRVLDKTTYDTILPPSRSSVFPEPATPSGLSGRVPLALPPNNSPEKNRSALLTPSRIPLRQLDQDTLVRLLEDSDKMHREVNNGLRPLILPRQAAKRHSLDLVPTGNGLGPRPLMLPQQLAKRPRAPARSSTLDISPVPNTFGPQPQFQPAKSIAGRRRSMSVQDGYSSQVTNNLSPPRQSRLYNDILSLLNDHNRLDTLVDCSSEDSQQAFIMDSPLEMSPESSLVGVLDGSVNDERLRAIMGLLDNAAMNEENDMRPVLVDDRAALNFF